MAGIGFELRKILKGRSINHAMRAYCYAGIIGSGPWIISVTALVVIYLLSAHRSVDEKTLLLQFQTSITYLISISLILSGLLQYAFTRYIADRLFEKKDYTLLANTLGAIFISTVISAIVGCLYGCYFLQNTPILYRICSACTLVVLTNLWVLSSLLSGLKEYKAILISFLIGYGLTIFLCTQSWHLGITGLMGGFFVGQAVLFLILLAVATKSYFSRDVLEFDFARKNRMHISLMFSGLFYNLAIWADKYCFWFYPGTGQHMIGSLNASLIYDLPMFLSLFLIIPGFSVFLFRMETDFVEYYQSYYDAIRGGGSLSTIESMHDQMVQSVRVGLIDIIKIQSILTFFGFLYGGKILAYFEFPLIQGHLFRVDMVAIDLLVIFLAMLNVIFYLDKRMQAFWMTLLLFILNLILTLVSLHMGVFYYGYGLLVALVLTNLVTLLLINKNFNRLTFETFMG
jgi:uncharacterized membrane protein